MIGLVPDTDERPRLDRRGRRIGRNWWREWITAELHTAEAEWQRKRESGEPIHTDAVPGATYDTAYYQLSEAEYRLIFPRPTLKDFLVANAGMMAYLAA